MRFHTADREERQIAWLWLAAAVSAFVLRPLWLALAPLLPGCPFRLLTGVPCPSCGTTRAALAFLHGRPFTAFALNPLSSLGLSVFALGGVIAPLWVALRGPVPELHRPLPPWARLALIAAFAANWAWVIARQG